MHFNFRQRNYFLLFALLIAACALIVFTPESSSAYYWVKDGIERLFGNAYRKIFTNGLLSIGFWIVLPATLILQRVIPAVPQQRIFGTAMAQDFVWFIYEAFFSVFIFGTFVLWAKDLYSHHLQFLTITTFLGAPEWVRFAIAVLLFDFLCWCHHIIQHRVSFFWKFHSLHHSQTELNFFSDFRYHVFEYFIRNIFCSFPFFVLELSPPTIVAYQFFSQWFSRFYHGNIRTNLGPLRYILVTPQSHRVHHSREPRHFDRNFGTLFSIWDRLLGTHYHGENEYPETGIPDSEFPLERSSALKDLLTTPFVQMFYPFKRRLPHDPDETP